MKLFKKFLIVIAIGLVPMIACDTDKLVELNEDPNAVTEMDWRYLLTNAQVDASENRYVNWRTGLIFSGLLIQSTGSPFAGAYSGGDVYDRGIIDHQNSYWDYVYIHALKTLAEIIRQTGPDGANPEMTNTYNVARIVYVMVFQYMTDYYGNVPYFGANRGIEGSDFFLPKYDSQQDIYTREGIGEGEVRGGLLWELDDAASKLASPGPDDLSRADLYYGGNLTKWRRLAYSLMLRAAMRINEVDGATAKKYIDKAIAGGVMQSNADDCWLQMASGPDIWFNQNGISRAMYPGDGDGHDSFRLSRTIIKFMQSHNDPRLMILSGGVGGWNDCLAGNANCDKDPANQFGCPNGYDGGDDAPGEGTGLGIKWWCSQDPECSARWDGTSDIEGEFFSIVNPLLLDLDEPYYFMSAGEVHLLLAEIAQRGITSTPKTAAQHYADGITYAIKRFENHDASFAVSDATINAYIAANPLQAGAAGLEQIAWQHWMSTFFAPNFYESFANWRRTGRPTLVPTNYPNNITGGHIFRKFMYDPQDQAINEENFKAGATLPNFEMTRMWWDVGHNGEPGGTQTQP